MSMKSWVLHRVQGLGGIAGRADLAPRQRGHEPDLDSDPGGRGDSGGDALRPGADLGVYAPLIGAVRDELEHFVASHVRLHVVIADRDRFLLTSIGVRSPGGAEARELLQQFMHEFKPEQVRRYLAREVIGRLPNAAVIDLALFGGLADLEANEHARDDGEYRELLAALRTTPASALAHPYEVSVLGRWSEVDAAPAPFARASAGPVPTTPLAGRAVGFDVSDRAGTRIAVLHAVVPGRRYVIGKDESSDVRVDGTYASRRHAEIWLEGDAWRVADAGSTNGIRVVDAQSGRARQPAPGTPPDAPLRLDDGMRVVLSALAEGPPDDYPTIALRPQRDADAAPVTPIAVGTAARAPKTPLTAVLPVRPPGPRFALTVADDAHAHAHALAIDADALPFTIGRSRDQALVIDRRHAGVSGRHVAIDAIDDEGVHGSVEGDNGVVVDGARHATGARFAWRPGETLVLGGSLPDEPPCVLALARVAED